MLRDREWRLKYTAEDGDLVRQFYVPALEDAERYDRLTGYFKAGALALAARGHRGSGTERWPHATRRRLYPGAAGDRGDPEG